MTDLDDTIPAFGQLLLRYRREAGLSQAELAKASGVSVRALRDLERGRASAAQERSSELLATALGLAGDERTVFLTLAREGRRRTTRPVDSRMLYALPVPANLVGREDELLRLAEEAEAGGVVVIVGLPGVGKTSLAVAAAHRLASGFPDGCLALDLAGTGDRPLSPPVALERMLAALGVSSARIPVSENDRMSLLRTLVRGRRMLVLLDNAVDEAQVRFLLGTGEGSTTIVTSRSSLPGLKQVRRLVLEPLSSAGAVWLLASIAGEEVVRADPDEALELVSLCGNLPLAVRIAGNRLATQRHWSLTYLVGQLRDERMRLTSLSAGDWQVRPAFEVSFRRLSPPAQRVFRRLTLVPGAHFGDDLAAVATGVPAGQIGTLLGELADASLLNAAGGRLRFHDLIRLFASERLAADEPEDVRNQLRDNLYRYVLGRAVAAGRLVFPDVLEVPADGPFATVDQAQEWLRQEGVNWSCAQRAAEELGWHREALELAQAMHWYADSHEAGYRWDEVYGVALRAARALGDRVAEVDMLNQLGWALYLCRNDNELAHATNSEALRLAEEVGDHRGTVFAHEYLGVELMRLGRNDEGLAHSYRACELAAGCDFFDVQVGVRTTLGVALRTAGRFDEALAVHSAVLTELDEHRDETNPVIGQWVAMVQLENIGLCLSGLERWREAATSHRDARLVSEEYRMAYHEVEQAVHEGVAWREAGEYDLARQCLALARDLLDGPVHHVGREKVDAEFALLPEQDERQWWRQE